MSLPTVVLHDHLDGGLRPATVLEIAAEMGYNGLPSTDLDELEQWFNQADSGSLERYLEAFDHTIAVMQWPDTIERVAYEAAVDLSNDGVVYAELRFATDLFTREGLTEPEVIRAAALGLDRAKTDTGIETRLIVDALRHLPNSERSARAAVEMAGSGVVGFDLAGPEAGYPPEDHLAACRLIRESGLRLTIHAGESGGADGVAYMAAAMDVCGAERFGHGIEIVDDCRVADGEIIDVGSVAGRILNRQVPLEICPTSNLATKGLEPHQHPIGMLHRAGFNVTISPDNRLMSSTTMSDEVQFAVDHHGFDVDDLADMTRRSLQAAFCDYETKALLWTEKIAPAYLEAGADLRSGW